MVKGLSIGGILVCLLVQIVLAQSNKINKSYYRAHKTSVPIVIDGKATDLAWNKADWHSIEHVWLGVQPDTFDFKGRFKMLWDEQFVYYLVEIQDDSLSDQHADPFDLWWEDDCLELFIDEDYSGGDHQYNHGAFAYHITLGLDIVDMGIDKKPLLLNDHMFVKWIKDREHHYTWEVAMKVFDDKFDPARKNKPVVLSEGKKMGFAVSYNDNDGHFIRENFIGSVYIEGEDKNKGWIDSSVFGTLELVE